MNSNGTFMQKLLFLAVKNGNILGEFPYSVACVCVSALLIKQHSDQL